MDKDIIARIAAEIHEAGAAGERLEGLSLRYPSVTGEEAYEIQKNLISLEKSELAGYKIAYTSEAVRQKNSLREPCSGRVVRERIIKSGGETKMPANGFVKIEPEVLFELKDDLEADDLTPEMAAAAIGKWYAAFEVVWPVFESPFWDLAGEIAENMSFGQVVIGSGTAYSPDRDPAQAEVVFCVNGTEQGRGPESAVMDGGPILSVVWLAGQLKARGEKLHEGDIILTGSPVAPYVAKRGDLIEASFMSPDGEMSCSVKVV